MIGNCSVITIIRSTQQVAFRTYINVHTHNLRGGHQNVEGVETGLAITMDWNRPPDTSKKQTQTGLGSYANSIEPGPDAL